MIQPSECLHDRLSVEAEYPPRFTYCLDCGTQFPLPNDYEERRHNALIERLREQMGPGHCGTADHSGKIEHYWVFVNSAARCMCGAFTWGEWLKEKQDAAHNTDDGYGFARGKGWKGPPPNPQKGR